MKIISTKVHGILDYMMGALMIASPYLFNFVDRSFAQYIPMAFGIAILAMAAITKFEYGLVNVVAVRFHLILDVFIGLFVATSPWIFGFNDLVYLPHLIFGLGEIAAAALTEWHPKTVTQHHTRHA